MASAELDLPLLPSADQIRRREFATVRRGYDPDQVREYLMKIADQVGNLEERVRVATTEAAVATAKASEQQRSQSTSDEDAYNELALRMAEVLRSAEEHAAKLHEEAEKEAGTILSDARAGADRISTDAQAKAEATRQEADHVMRRAEEEAQRTLASLRSRRDALVSELEGMRERMLAMAQSLREVYTPPEKVNQPSRSSDPPVTFSEADFASLWVGHDNLDISLPDMPAVEKLWDPDEQQDSPDL